MSPKFGPVDIFFPMVLGSNSTILAFQHVPNIRVRFLILGSGNPRIRDLYLELGSGNPKTRDGFKRKIGLFQVLGAQKILKCNTEQISVRICFPSAFVVELLSFC